MEVDNGDKRSAEQAASLFGTPEVESQRRNAGGKKINWKIITGVSFNYLSNQNQADFGPHRGGSFSTVCFCFVLGFFGIRKLVVSVSRCF